MQGGAEKFSVLHLSTHNYSIHKPFSQSLFTVCRFLGKVCQCQDGNGDKRKKIYCKFVLRKTWGNLSEKNVTYFWILPLALIYCY